MKRSTDRILTTHVGSLIRPPALQEFLRARQQGKPYDEQAYQACLRQSVAEVVREQAEAGVDVVSDGEFGKSISWSQYALERLSGFERRPVRAGANPFQRGADRAEIRRVLRRARCAGRRRHQLGIGLRRPDHLTAIRPSSQRDIDNFKAALAAVNVAEAFLPVAAPASVIPDRKNEYYASDEACLVAIAEAMRTEYRTIVDAGFLVQLDDARTAVTYDRMVPPASFADYRKWVARHVEILNHAIEGIPRERIRYHVCWGSWPGPHVTDVPLKDIVDLILGLKRRRLRDRGRQSAPRARMAGVGERQAAGRYGADPRRHQPRHQHRRASGAGRRAHRPPRAGARPRERDRRNRLRLRPGTVPPARPSLDHVGEAGSARRGRAPRQPRAVAQGGVITIPWSPAHAVSPIRTPSGRRRRASAPARRRSPARRSGPTA